MQIKIWVRLGHLAAIWLDGSNGDNNGFITFWDTITNNTEQIHIKTYIEIKNVWPYVTVYLSNNFMKDEYVMVVFAE